MLVSVSLPNLSEAEHYYSALNMDHAHFDHHEHDHHEFQSENKSDNLESSQAHASSLHNAADHSHQTALPIDSISTANSFIFGHQYNYDMAYTSRIPIPARRPPRS